MSQTLIVMPSVPMACDGDGYFMDIKAVDGLRRYAEAWPGPVKCLMRLGGRERIAYGHTYAATDLPFTVEAIGDNLAAHHALLDEAAVVLASGDNYRDLDIGAVTRSPIVFIIEYTLATRLRILQLEHGLSLQTLKSTIWTLLTERKRRSAFRRAAGLQANGTPAFAAYRAITHAPLLYFDNRMSERQQAIPQQMTDKIAYITSGQPLRLAFSGRLARLKGADHLVPVIIALAARGVIFTFDIFGGGELAAGMQSALDAAGMADKVRFHGPVSFDDVLVPALKQRIDLFVCCHRQADPSCTYIETMACGVPIVGYDNAAFKGVRELGPIGEAVPMARPHRLADAIAALDRDRPRLAAMAGAAITVANQHSFEATFSSRIDHLKTIAGI